MTVLKCKQNGEEKSSQFFEVSFLTTSVGCRRTVESCYFFVTRLDKRSSLLKFVSGSAVLFIIYFLFRAR